ncbi:MAG: PilX N-terminal domain-containing pilus assembly protein, partial [Chromatiales bacterium]
MNRNHRSVVFHAMHSQRGAATIAVAIILLILITLAVFTVSGSIVRETKVINSGVRSQQAFEAAEAGLAAAADYFGKDWDRDNDGDIDLVYDTDGDGIGNKNTA